MKTVKALTAVIAAALLCRTGASAEGLHSRGGGALLYHSYSSYEASDSRLYCYDFSSKEISEINSGEFIHPMNGDFGSHPYDAVFMAIDPAADEWDLYRYNLFTCTLTNLTENSGFRNEDPKFSPDGNKIVFKRGYWSSERNDFVYNLAELDLHTGEVTMLTDDFYEDSMPCYSEDGSKIYYARLGEGNSSIYELDRAGLETREVYCESGVMSYYPMTAGESLYFTKWHSADNMTDSIVKIVENCAETLPFSSTAYNCSDPFAQTDGSIFYSSTEKGSYDLYFYDGESSAELQQLNTELHELGASYYSDKELETILDNTAGYLLKASDTELNMDADGSGSVDCFDLAAMRKSVS